MFTFFRWMQGQEVEILEGPGSDVTSQGCAGWVGLVGLPQVCKQKFLPQSLRKRPRGRKGEAGFLESIQVVQVETRP